MEVLERGPTDEKHGADEHGDRGGWVDADRMAPAVDVRFPIVLPVVGEGHSCVGELVWWPRPLAFRGIIGQNRPNTFKVAER